MLNVLWPATVYLMTAVTNALWVVSTRLYIAGLRCGGRRRRSPAIRFGARPDTDELAVSQGHVVAFLFVQRPGNYHSLNQPKH